MKLTIVGAGVAGSALAREAAAQGHTARVVSESAPAASRAALAILRRSWLPPEHRTVDNDAVGLALRTYAAARCEIVEGAIVSSWRSPGPGKLVPDWYAVRPDAFLMPYEHVEGVPPDWVDPDADWTIHCTSTELVDPAQTTWGTTWLHFEPRKVVKPGPALRIHHYAPYKSADMVRYTDSVRLGSSASRSLAGCRREASRIMNVALEQGWVTEDAGWVSVTGVRANRPAHITIDAARRWATLGGFHRLGWSLAPLRARQLIGQLR